MPTIGVICPFDKSYQSFATCIACHENRDPKRNCNAPVFALKAGRDNHIDRHDAGISVSMLTSCPREIALTATYDVYEDVISLYNKARGSWTHAMIEADTDPPPWIIREQRLYVDIDGVRLTGKPDEIDTEHGVLVDYKSKDNLPLKFDPSHELQFNAYAYLLKFGRWMNDSEHTKKDAFANITIKKIGAHYVTWKTKTEKAWRKQPYPVWESKETERILRARLAAIVAWQATGILPKCDPYQVFPGSWQCHCKKLEQQLQSRGVTIAA